MIPLLIGAAAVGLGAALLSDDEPEHQEVTREKHYLNSGEGRRIERSGRVKTIGESESALNAASSSSMRFVCSGDIEKDIEKIDNMFESPNVSEKFIIQAITTFEKYYDIKIL